MGGTTPWDGGPVLNSHGEQASKQHFPMASALIPTTRYLP